MLEIHGFEVAKIVSQYKICIDGAPNDLRVDIVEDVMRTYRAYCNYNIKSENFITQYKHNRIHKTEEEALSAILSFFKEESRSKKITWVKCG